MLGLITTAVSENKNIVVIQNSQHTFWKKTELFIHFIILFNVNPHEWIAQSTLRNYAAMIQELDGIPIPDSISQLVWKSIEQLTVVGFFYFFQWKLALCLFTEMLWSLQCEEFIFRGQYVNALKSSQRAYEAADGTKIFFCDEIL